MEITFFANFFSAEPTTDNTHLAIKDTSNNWLLIANLKKGGFRIEAGKETMHSEQFSYATLPNVEFNKLQFSETENQIIIET
ncbi:MAG: hypothetical protein ACXITV_02095, partial [Luteibaculaceae bacterium]